MTIAENIRKFRRERGLTQKQLGEKCGMYESQIRKYELGTANPKTDTVKKIADVLNVSIDRLMGDSVSCIIENRLKEINKTLEQIAREADVSLYWLQHLDTFTPGEFGDYEIGYDWITRVADVLDLPGSTLRTALARQEIPIPDDLPRVTVSEAFGGENTYKPKNKDDLGLLSVPEQDHIKKYRDLDSHGKEMVDFTLQKEWERSTSEQKVNPIVLKEDTAYYVNAAHPIEDASAEDKQFDEGIMDDENF